MHWYRKAAKQGHPHAQFRLGMLYVAGRGTKPDPIVAYCWLHLAALEKHSEARQAREELAFDLTPGQIEEAERLANFLKPKFDKSKPTGNGFNGFRESGANQGHKSESRKKGSTPDEAAHGANQGYKSESQKKSSTPDEEQDAGDKALQAKTPQEYEKYLQYYPQGRFVQQAKMLLSDSLRIALLQDINNPVLRRRYLAMRTQEQTKLDTGQSLAVFFWLQVLTYGGFFAFVTILFSGYQPSYIHELQLRFGINNPVIASFIGGAVMGIFYFMFGAGRRSKEYNITERYGPLPIDFNIRMEDSKIRLILLGE